MDASRVERFLLLTLESLRLQRSLILGRMTYMDQKLNEIAASIEALKVAQQVAASREADEKTRADTAEASLATAAPSVDTAAIEARLEAFRQEIDAITASLQQPA